MHAPALAEAVVDLPWLSPCAGSLMALVRLPAADAWIAVRGDPGLVLLWARRPAANSNGAFAAATLQDPWLIENALHFLDSPTFVDWNQPAIASVYQACYLQATLAHALASRVPSCDPDRAWIAGLLVPLGWIAVAAVNAGAVETCRQHADFPSRAARVQQQCWGLDHGAIARRLCRRWNLPAWLAAVIGRIGLPAEIARTLGADPKLLQVVQLAVGLTQQRGQGLGLVVGASAIELMSALDLTAETVDAAFDDSIRLATASFPLTTWEAPTRAGLLSDYLRLAQEQRGRADETLLTRVQNELDQLHRVFEEHCAGEQDRLRDAKLRALAELAAGAGHEINNPLAVISGQAQYLMARETDPARSKALQTINVQARRIHQILTDLMQFARPSAPQKQLVDIGALVRDVTLSLQAQAEQAQVKLLCPEQQPVEGHVYADPAQLHAMLTALLRNGIEAAPADGWVSLRVQPTDDHRVRFIVEDSGPGLAVSAREHMFDPFFSGRSAGRGRGLGLTTAWRLAQLNGGELCFEPAPQGPTRFVLQLSLVDVPTLGSDRPRTLDVAIAPAA